MKVTIDIYTETQENGDVEIKATATVDGSVKSARVRHTIPVYELDRSYDRQKLIDSTESRVITSALAAARSKL